MNPLHVDASGKRGFPAWVYLTYDNIKPKSQRGWKDNLAPCIGSSTTRHCDEYPFFSTEQGGPNSAPEPSLEQLDGPQNIRQGAKLGAFYKNCGLSNKPGTAFLSIPAPAGSRVPTQTRVCNGHPPTP